MTCLKCNKEGQHRHFNLGVPISNYTKPLSLSLEDWAPCNARWKGFPAVLICGLLFTAPLAPMHPRTSRGHRGARWARATVEGGRAPREGAGTGPEPRRPCSLCLAGLVPEPSGQVAQAREGWRTDPPPGAALPRAALGHPPSQPLPGRQPLPSAPPRAGLGLDGRCRRRRRRLPEPPSASRLGQPAAQRGAAGPEHFPGSRRVPAPGLHQPSVRQVTRSLGRLSVCLSVFLIQTLGAGRRQKSNRGYTHLFLWLNFRGCSQGK